MIIYRENSPSPKTNIGQTWIHRFNLKKQGMLGLTFATKSDYDKFQEDDTIETLDLAKFASGKPIELKLTHKDGSSDVIVCEHTYNENQIVWFKKGSALNLIKELNN